MIQTRISINKQWSYKYDVIWPDFLVTITAVPIAVVKWGSWWGPNVIGTCDFLPASSKQRQWGSWQEVANLLRWLCKQASRCLKTWEAGVYVSVLCCGVSPARLAYVCAAQLQPNRWLPTSLGPWEKEQWKLFTIVTCNLPSWLPHWLSYSKPAEKHTNGWSQDAANILSVSQLPSTWIIAMWL